MFKEGLPQVPAISLWEILDKEGLPHEAPRGHGEVLALHDSCTARSAREIQDSVRSIIQKLGYRIEELPYSREMTKCCGYGGLMYLVDRGLTEKVIRSRVEESPMRLPHLLHELPRFLRESGQGRRTTFWIIALRRLSRRRCETRADAVGAQRKPASSGR